MFGPGTVSWKVNREGVLLLGGGRALLLQVAHPLVAAGVTQHSSYDVDPWGRLFRTLDLTYKITFGDREASAAAAARLRRAHRHVRGRTGDGHGYDAADPDLLLWVWATLLDTSIAMYRRYVAALSDDEAEDLYGEQTRFLLACGGPEGSWPGGYDAFRRYFDATVERELEPSGDFQKIADAVLDPRLPVPLRPLTRVVNLITVGTLPATLRRRLGLEWGPGRQRVLDASTPLVRRLMPLIPTAIRHLPAAYATRTGNDPRRRATRNDAIWDRTRRSAGGSATPLPSDEK